MWLHVWRGSSCLRLQHRGGWMAGGEPLPQAQEFPPTADVISISISRSRSSSICICVLCCIPHHCLLHLNSVNKFHHKPYLFPIIYDSHIFIIHHSVQATTGGCSADAVTPYLGGRSHGCLPSRLWLHHQDGVRRRRSSWLQCSQDEDNAHGQRDCELFCCFLYPTISNTVTGLGRVIRNHPIRPFEPRSLPHRVGIPTDQSSPCSRI